MPSHRNGIEARAALLPLTSLRFFAALHVVLYHGFGSFPQSLVQGRQWMTNFTKTGYTGVSVFFILSGFILSYNYLGTDLHLNSQRKAFWLARIARVYPVYLLGLIFAAPKLVVGLVAAHVGAGSAALIGFCAITLTQAWVPQLALAWNGPGWSLSAEAFFYLLFPFLALRVQALRTCRSCFGLAALCWTAAMLPPALLSWFGSASPTLNDCVKFDPLMRLAEFCIGICVGKIFLERLRREGQGHFPAVPLLAVTTVLIGLSLNFLSLVPKLFWHNGLLDPLFALAIFCLGWTGIHARPSTSWLSFRPLVTLGEASYALYILHAPIRGLLLGSVKGLWPALPETVVASSLMFCLYLSIAIGASILTFRFVETSARRWIKQRFGVGPERLAPPASERQAVAVSGRGTLAGDSCAGWDRSCPPGSDLGTAPAPN